MAAHGVCGRHHNKGGVGCLCATVELIHPIPIFSKKITQTYHITNPYFVKLDNLKNELTIMLMESLQLDDIKHGRLTRDELETVHGHLLIQHAGLVADIAFVETVLYPEHDEQLQVDFEVQGQLGW